MTPQPRPGIKYLVSQPYGRSDFSDIIAGIIEATRPKVISGRIELKLVCKSQEIQRFGKTFFITLVASGDQIVVKINEKK